MKLGCVKPHFIGDGYCDDELNKEECNYDDGDCCGVHLDNKFCRECQCLNPGKMMSAPNYLEDFIIIHTDFLIVRISSVCRIL